MILGFRIRELVVACPLEGLFLEGSIILPKRLHSTSRGYPHGAIQLFAMDQQ